MAASGFQATTVQLCLNGANDVMAQARAAFDAAPDTDLFVFPEYSVHAEDAYVSDLPWAANNPLENAFRMLVMETGKAVVFGSLHRLENGHLTSRAWFLDPRTGQESFYDKTHIHWTETWARPGDHITPIDTRFGRMGLLICYDMAFAESALTLGRQGADLLCAIAAIPAEFNWQYTHRRLAGAAIFNQFHVISAHLGAGEAAPMGGHSAIFCAEGSVLAQVDGDTPGHATAKIDLHAQEEWRAREIVSLYRRPGLYRCLADEPWPQL